MLAIRSCVRFGGWQCQAPLIHTSESTTRCRTTRSASGGGRNRTSLQDILIFRGTLCVRHRKWGEVHRPFTPPGPIFAGDVFRFFWCAPRLRPSAATTRSSSSSKPSSASLINYAAEVTPPKASPAPALKQPLCVTVLLRRDCRTPTYGPVHLWARPYRIIYDTCTRVLHEAKKPKNNKNLASQRSRAGRP